MVRLLAPPMTSAAAPKHPDPQPHQPLRSTSPRRASAQRGKVAGSGLNSGISQVAGPSRRPSAACRTLLTASTMPRAKASKFSRSKVVCRPWAGSPPGDTWRCWSRCRAWPPTGFFGVTFGWMRDVAIAQAVQRRLQAPQFDWASESVREAGHQQAYWVSSGAELRVADEAEVNDSSPLHRHFRSPPTTGGPLAM